MIALRIDHWDQRIRIILQITEQFLNTASNLLAKLHMVSKNEFITHSILFDIRWSVIFSIGLLQIGLLFFI